MSQNYWTVAAFPLGLSDFRELFKYHFVDCFQGRVATRVIWNLYIMLVSGKEIMNIRNKYVYFKLLETKLVFGGFRPVTCNTGVIIITPI